MGYLEKQSPLSSSISLGLADCLHKSTL